jgi:hypothetical protein
MCRKSCIYVSVASNCRKCNDDTVKLQWVEPLHSQAKSLCRFCTGKKIIISQGDRIMRIFSDDPGGQLGLQAREGSL